MFWFHATKLRVTTFPKFHSFCVRIERNIVNDLSTALKSSQARDTTRLVNKHNLSNQCKNRHMSQVLNEQSAHVGKNIKASQHVNSTGEPSLI